MNRSRCVVASIVLSSLAALALEPERAALASDGDPVCTLSPTQADSSVQAFGKMAATFTGQERCANCHGAVDPFAPNAAEAHAGGKFSPVMTVGPDGSTGVDVAQTFAPCAECHSALPGWRLSPRDLFFVGKDAPTLCKQQKKRFSSVGGFLGHIDSDNGGVQFIDTGFQGTRGLNEYGRSFAGDYHPEPPLGITHAGLIQQSNAWATALGGEFRGPDWCGCEKHRYAMKVDQQMELIAGPAHLSGATTLQFPITFADDGSFSGSGQSPLTMTGQLNAMCSLTETAPVSWEITGTSDTAPPGNAPTLHVKAAWTMPGGSGTVTCVTPAGASTRPFPMRATSSSAHPSPSDQFDLVGAVGQEKTLKVKPPYQRTTTFSIVQVD
jgi:hypothetical protein